MSRYLIIGCSGSGKSTLAKEISSMCAATYTDIDALYWRGDWTLCSDVEVISELPLDEDAWVFDGNFVGHRDQVWSKASTIIWLDPPRSHILYRLIKRNLSWFLHRKSTWTGNRMPLKIAVSGIIHGFSRFSDIQSQFPAYLRNFPKKQIYRIQTDSDRHALLHSIQSKR